LLTIDGDEDDTVRARRRRVAHPPQPPLHVVAQTLEDGGEQDVVLEAVTASSAGRDGAAAGAPTRERYASRSRRSICQGLASVTSRFNTTARITGGPAA
jgi:hypothetical protein